MAWNGRNVSILGEKAAAAAAANDIPAPQSNNKAENTTSNKNKDAIKKVAAPAPTASVWTGRHQKIMAIRDPTPVAADASSVASSTKTPTDTSPKLEELSVSSPKDVKVFDETTNSTAGSSTTNTTIEDAESNPASAVDVKVVTTNVTEKKNDTNEGSSNGAGVSRPRSDSKSKVNKNNGNSQGNNNNNKTYSRGNGSGGSARRRANNGEKQLCTFFMQGRCNRGTSCTFRHDPAHAPNASNNAPSSNNAKANASASSGNKTKSAPARRSNSGHNKNYQPNTTNTNMARQSSAGSAGSGAGAPYIPHGKRTFDPHKARAIQLAKQAQDQEDRSRFASSVKIIPSDEDKKEEEDVVAEPPIFSIDVECIATGFGSCARGINDGCGNEGQSKEGIPANQYNERSHRYPGRIAMVDSEGNLVTDIVIRPPQDGKGVVSYLTPLTGLTMEMCLGDDAKSLQEAVDTIKGLLPKNAILVGQAIDHDVEWLGLTPGKDFERMVDISEIFRQRMPAVLAQAAEVLKAKEADELDDLESSSDPSSDEYLGFATRYRHFSLRHVCLNLLGTDIQSGVHDPIVDAKYSLMLFHKYRNSSVTQLRIVRDGLHRAPITPGFAAENTPVIDGVCVSAAGYRYKFAARRILRWYQGKKTQTS